MRTTPSRIAARLARLAPLARGQGLPRRPLAGHQGGARRDQPLRGRRLRPLAARRRGARHSAAFSADRYVVRRRHARAVLHGTLDASSRRLQQVPVARLRAPPNPPTPPPTQEKPAHRLCQGSARVAAAVGRPGSLEEEEYVLLYPTGAREDTYSLYSTVFSCIHCVRLPRIHAVL